MYLIVKSLQYSILYLIVSRTTTFISYSIRICIVLYSRLTKSLLIITINSLLQSLSIVSVLYKQIIQIIYLIVRSLQYLILYLIASRTTTFISYSISISIVLYSRLTRSPLVITINSLLQSLASSLKTLITYSYFCITSTSISSQNIRIISLLGSQ